MNNTIKTKPDTECSKESNGFPCLIPAQRIMHLISSKWGIQLIYLLMENKKLRYNDLRESLQKGWTRDKISDATLSTRLADFTKEGLIKREVFPELPPKVEYSLTRKGEKLANALQPLVEWTINACHGKE
ncbi:MAG: helix-turn-helix transcriptional regulator [Candidatus Heimdallarchaeota archaeon]|nr:helix-turn-helix transcriptional regulator [Candidatus Heimdallarchaeota archaeon]